MYSHLSKLPIKIDFPVIQQKQSEIIDTFNNIFDYEYQQLTKNNLLDVFDKAGVNDIINSKTIIFSKKITLFESFEIHYVPKIDSLIVKCLVPLNRQLLTILSIINKRYNDFKVICKSWYNDFTQIESIENIVPYQKLLAIRKVLLCDNLVDFQLDYDYTKQLQKYFTEIFESLGKDVNKYELKIILNSDRLDRTIKYKVIFESIEKEDTLFHQFESDVLLESEFEKSNIDQFLNNLYIYGTI